MTELTPVAAMAVKPADMQAIAEFVALQTHPDGADLSHHERALVTRALVAFTAKAVADMNAAMKRRLAEQNRVVGFPAGGRDGMPKA
jgi:hypothetical protein